MILQIIDAGRIRTALSWPDLVEALRAGFASGATTTVPQRHHHGMGAADDREAPTMLLMPAWNPDHAGVKVVAVFPRNRDTDIATINGSYFLMSGETGAPLAVLDGGELTARRTAAASVLAATLLAPPDARRLLVVGSGRLAGNLARAYAALFALADVAVWNHRAEGAERLTDELRVEGIEARAVTDLAAACRAADIVTCATLSSDPVVLGEWLAPGAHLDLVGGFTPTMRETDDDAIRRAEVYVDTIAGASAEAGDIVQPIANGALDPRDIRGDLFALCTPGAAPVRHPTDITLFKSVGHALEDLVAAAAVFERVQR